MEEGKVCTVCHKQGHCKTKCRNMACFDVSVCNFYIIILYCNISVFCSFTHLIYLFIYLFIYLSLYFCFYGWCDISVNVFNDLIYSYFN